jgi:mannonate dehydratase
MEQCWRWFGPDDPVTLEKISQAGATGIVTALHDVATGAAWSRDKIAARNREIEAAGLRWSVVESVPVHSDIQLGSKNRDEMIANYVTTIRNLADVGIRVICYNFMPVLDWTRTDLEYRLPNGAEALRFDIAKFATYDVFILKREDAEHDYDADVLKRARENFAALDVSAKDELERSIIAGLPGGDGSYGREELRAEIERFRAVGEEGLRDNLAYFLSKVVPVAAECGIRMAIHPDDPPFSLFGLPRILSTPSDVRQLFEVVDCVENGLTLCAGSFGARADNDLTAIAREFGSRVHFVHLRNVSREADGSFHESEHLAGDNDLVELIATLLDQEHDRLNRGAGAQEIPMRPDHGHTIGDELGESNVNPGYSYLGRLKGLAELRGVIQTLEWTRRTSGSAGR